ncbi:polyketide biosynthesis protein PksE [Micromonospora qiuiae]|uniref:[acyl-carrier-protein] S-malonyltransferase n=1 Tax=Micromonospora qiuiae TaxID=502268 RepID=A0ABQ4JJ37_9ACTN|nr:acyltransferase domain-containing protein [Micromonospora qiuiae]GIJ29512.1 polyketide biosynthesis protein PksE [Micromonospora qiuiae]
MTDPRPPGDVVVFPGQGSQRTGMAADYHREFETVRRTFAEASDVVGEDLRRICFEPDPRLHLTEFTQPCVLTAEVAAYRVAVAEFGLRARYFGGHSLGEYTALVAAGALPFAEAVSLVRARGALMQQAVPAGQGSMAALLLDDVADSGAVDVALATGLEVANVNSPVQIVVSGAVENLERAREALARSHPSLTFVRLKVSAPFHSSAMRPAEDEFAAELARHASRLRPDRAAAVTSNYTGDFHEPAALMSNLVRQITGPVRWLENMRTLAGTGEGQVFEIGPRAALAKFFRAYGRTAIPVTNLAEAATLLSPGRVGRAPELSTATGGGQPVAAGGSLPDLTPAELTPGRLGDPGFRADHGVRWAYVVGGLAPGVTSPRLVIRLAGAGLLGYLGVDGLDPAQIKAAVGEVRAGVPAGAPWGVSVAHDPHHPALAARTIDLLRRLDVNRLEAIGFTDDITELVGYRLAGLRLVDGRPRPARRLLARVSRPEVARLFLGPPPTAVVDLLRERGVLTTDEARLAAYLPVADDVCVDASATGQPNETSLLPGIRRLRDRIAADHGWPAGSRVGVAGELGTPEVVAAAFVLGADFVLTGALNMCTPEAGASALAKDMLADAGVGDFATAPAYHTFEAGGRVAVLRRGLFFPSRADKLHQLYQSHTGGDMDPAERERIEKQFFGRGFDEVWAEIAADHAGWDQEEIRRAERDGRLRFALLCRWYLREAARRAMVGDIGDRLNFLIPGGPAVGAFNDAVRGTVLEKWADRHVDRVAEFLMLGAAAVVAGHWQSVQPAG